MTVSSRVLKVESARDLLHQRATGGLALRKGRAHYGHRERLSRGRHEALDVLPDLADAAGGALDLALGITNLAANGMLVIDVGGAEPFETSNLGLPGLLHQARVAGGDRLGHRELVRLTLAEVFEAPDADIARERGGDEAGLALVVLPHGGVEGAERRISKDVDFVSWLPCLTILPSRCSICDGSQGTSR
jgi:hypothetical protein